jgi:hypothetical protein
MSLVLTNGLTLKNGFFYERNKKFYRFKRKIKSLRVLQRLLNNFDYIFLLLNILELALITDRYQFVSI